MMTKAICSVAVVLTLTIYDASLLAAQSAQNGSIQTGQLNSRIGPANPQRYKSIHDAKNWQNPILIIRQDGVEVISKSLPSGRRTVASTDLRRTLIDLPVTAWPYGSVVAVQDIGLRAADFSDAQPIEDNRKGALSILKSLHITVEGWPTA